VNLAKVLHFPMNELSLAEAAIEYARAGFRVFPLHDAGSNKGKQPRIRNWQNIASSDETQIRQWWEKFPDANIGLLTGSEVGFYALDIDPRHGGNKSLAKLIEQHGQLPETVIQHTGGGGYHYLFRCPNLQKNRIGVLDGIDIKADKGYIVASPSVHPDTKKRYEWESILRKKDIAEPPHWLSEILSESTSASSFKLTKLKEYKKPAVIPNGNRNHSLFIKGCSLKSSGFSNDDIVSSLISINLTECEEPLTKEELQIIVDRVLSYKCKHAYLIYRDWILSEDCPCDPLCRLILVTITTFMNSKKITAYPTQELLSEMTGISRETISKKLKRAADHGWIELTKHKVSKQKYSNNVYIIPARFR